MNSLLLISLLLFGNCKKSNDTVQVVKDYTVLTEKILKNSDVISTVFSDTTFQIHPGIEETDIHYMNMQGAAMHMFILKVDLNNPDLTLEAATPYDAPAIGSSQTVQAMAKYEDATKHRVMAGINGDFFRVDTYVPLGIVYKDGAAVKPDFSDNSDKPQQGLSFLGILNDGKPMIGDREQYAAVKSQLKEALGGGVFLVRDHKPVQYSITSVEPRTAVGVTADNIVYFIVADGRNFYYSNGIDYEQLTKLMQALNVKDAINLDGGGSSTFMIRHPLADVWQVRNRPSDGAPRSIADSWLVISKSKL